ncbi:hypothetical protein [Fimbriiglobus ruber]|nr:hypothetical protein [Fimbriiglobus ruber]
MGVHLVCEGFRQGLDERVLDAVVIQYHNLPVLTSPSGGSSGLGAVRAYLESRSHNDVAVAVEDRNHRPLAGAAATWTSTAGRSFIWRRHEIENYLLHPRVVLELFNLLRTTPGLPWAAGLPATEPDVDALLQSLAVRLLDDHAAEVLRDEIVRLTNAAGSVRFGGRRPAPLAGTHGPGQPQWLAALQAEAARLCQTCTAVASLQPLQSVQITARYTTLVAQYHQQTFLTTGDYLRDMGGHELLAALSRHLRTLGAGARFDEQFLGDELLRQLGKIYVPNTLFQPDDFDELATILGQY